MNKEKHKKEIQRNYRSAIFIVVPIFAAICAALWLSTDIPIQYDAYDNEHSGRPADAVNSAANVATMAIADLFVPRDHDPEATIQSAEVSEGALALALRLAARKFAELPPAAVPSSSGGAGQAKRVAAKMRLEVVTPNGLPRLDYSQKMMVTVASIFDTKQIEVGGLPVHTDMIVGLDSRVSIEFDIQTEGWFGGIEKFAPVTYADTAELQREGGLDLHITPVSEERELGNLHVQFRLHNIEEAPRILRASAGDGVAILDSRPAAEEGYALRILVPAAGSFTYVLVWGRESSVQAQRADGGSRIVGTEMPGLPLFAAAADGWGSLQIMLRNNPFAEPANYRVLAASGESGAAESLLLGFVSTQLPQLTHDGAPLTAEQVRQAIVWVSHALGIERSRDALLASLPPELAVGLHLAPSVLEQP